MAGQSWSKEEWWRQSTGPFSSSPSSAPDHLKSGPRVWARARAGAGELREPLLTLRGPRGARLPRCAGASSPAGPGTHPLATLPPPRRGAPQAEEVPGKV